MLRNNCIFSFAFLTASLALGQAPSPSESPAAKPFLPIGKVIQCTLVFTVNSTSTKVKTPVIGTVQRDIYQDGKIVVPSGTVVACVVEQAVAFRDRIQVAGKWHLTYPDGKTGIEFEGVACDREADSDNRNFSPEDGSAGLLGNVIGGGDRFVRVPAGKEFYIVTTDAFVQGESIKKDAPATLNEILPLPLGCIIPCAFICGVDAQSHPPVSAVVITDVWWEGKMIIPKGAVVDALRQPVFVFDRMQLKGLWVIYGCETRVFR